MIQLSIPGQFCERVLSEDCLKVSIIEKMVDIHVKVQHPEVGAAGQQEELDHLRGVAAVLLLFLLEVAVLGVVIIERQVELCEVSEVVTAGFEDGTVLDLEADDPEEAEFCAVGGDAEQV